MDIDHDKQNEAIERAKEILRQSEQRRAAVRLEKCFRDVQEGNVTVLENDEIVHNLAHFMYAMHEDGETAAVLTVLENLGKGACHQNTRVRERAIMVLSVFIGITMEHNEESFVGVISKALVRWLKEEQEYITGFEFVSMQLQKQLQVLLAKQSWQEAEDLLVVLHEIQTGVLEKANIIKMLVTRVMNQLASEETMEQLVSEYLDHFGNNREIAKSLLIHLGYKGIAFIVKKLTVEENRNNRFLLIELIPNIPEVYQVVRDVLATDPPWYVVRNCIHILSRSADPGLYDLIRPYTKHSDMRVQQQAVNGIWKMGGDQLTQRLLEALQSINDELKISLITQLGEMTAEADVGKGFIQLLEKRGEFSQILKDQLILTLCQQMAGFPSAAASVVLQEIETERVNSHGGDDNIAHAAGKALQAMEEGKEDVGDETPPEKSPIDHSRYEEAESDGEGEAFLSLDFDDEEQESIFASQQDALDQIEDLHIAGLDDQHHHEDQLQEQSSDDDAFAAILAEAGSMTNVYDEMDELDSEDAQHHISLWSDFYDLLDSSEFSTLYALLERRDFSAGEVLVQGSSTEETLFFIDAGDVDLVAPENGSSMHLKNLTAGDIIGGRTFFNKEPWLFSLIAQEAVSLHCLNRARCQEFLDRYPGVLEKLERYCQAHDVVSKLLSHLVDRTVVHENVKLVTLNKQLKNREASMEEPLSGACLVVTHSGICVEMPLIDEMVKREINGLLVEAVISDKDQKSDKCFGVVIGWLTLEEDSDYLTLLIKFYHPYRTDQFTCQSVTFL